MEKRCDRRKDCSDGSDEKDCLMVHRSWETASNILRDFYFRDPSYNKQLTPIPETGSTGKTLLIVNMSITIVDIVDINELAKKFTIKFTFTRDWFDFRLTYMNLKVTLIKIEFKCKHIMQNRSLDLNDLTTDEASTLWFPQVAKL